MALFRFIFSIVFVAPIRWFSNLFARSIYKDNLLEWHLSYSPLFIKIQTKHKEQVLSDDLLIASYILFLSQYFYICDERQINTVRNFLFDTTRNPQKPEEMVANLYEKVFTTLNPTEQKNIVRLLNLFEPIPKPLPTPPFVYSEEAEPTYSFAKYSFLVFSLRGSDLGFFLRMSTGPDIILLPLTVGILYVYVGNKIRSEDKKNKLDRSILTLLENHKTVGCRSIAGLKKLPNMVIREQILEKTDNLKTAQEAMKKGVEYYKQGNYDGVISEFTKVIEFAPNYADAYLNRGMAYSHKKNYEQAISDFTKIIELDQNDANVYMIRGLAYFGKENYDQAISDFTKAIELDPNFAEHYYNRGIAYGNKGSYDLAISDFTTAIKLNPNYAPPYYSRGAAYYEKGNYDKSWVDVHKVEALGGSVDTEFLEKLKQASGREK